MSTDSIRRSTSATLGEIVASERQFKEQHGVDISEPDDWQQLKDIVARLEQRWAPATKESAE